MLHRAQRLINDTARERAEDARKRERRLIHSQHLTLLMARSAPRDEACDGRTGQSVTQREQRERHEQRRARTETRHRRHPKREQHEARPHNSCFACTIDQAAGQVTLRDCLRHAGVGEQAADACGAVAVHSRRHQREGGLERRHREGAEKSDRKEPRQAMVRELMRQRDDRFGETAPS